MHRLATRLVALVAVALVAPFAQAQTPTVTVTNDITANTTWTANEVYLLDNIIYVRPGATLTIEPGTVIKGKKVPTASSGDNTSGLIVMVGARLVADGRQDAPIIFTAEIDDVDDPSDTDEFTRQEWGGIVLLGRSTTNATPAITNIEGVDPSDDTRFGCDSSTAGFACDEDDDSGVLRYVSIRHAGFGLRPGNEINGLTLGAVGRGTVLEHIEVFANSDDAFEFFGGTAQAKYLVSAFVGDDGLDTDRGFRGKVQYFFLINNPGLDGGRCTETDGGVSDFGGEDSQPYARPIYSNLTCIGAGTNADRSQLGEDGNSATFQIRDNSGGAFYNSIATEYPGTAINLEALASGEDTENRFGTNTEGTDDLVIRNNLFFGYGGGADFASLVDDDSDNAASRQQEIEAAIAGANTIADPQLAGVCRAQGCGTLDPRPLASGPAAAGASFSDNQLDGDDFFDEVDYYGAFEPTSSASSGDNPTWLSGWTALAQMGYLSGAATPVAGGPEAAFSLAVGPNPTRGDATVRFTLGRAQRARIALYDVLGREVAVVAEGAFAAGEASAVAPTAGLPAGVYVLRLQGEAGAVARTLSVVR